MAHTNETPADKAGASRDLLGGWSRTLDSQSTDGLQARLAGLPFSELIDDALLPHWRDLGGLATLGDALAMAGKVRRDRLTGSGWHV